MLKSKISYISGRALLSGYISKTFCRNRCNRSHTNQKNFREISANHRGEHKPVKYLPLLKRGWKEGGVAGSGTGQTDF